MFEGKESGVTIQTGNELLPSFCRPGICFTQGREWRNEVLTGGLVAFGCICVALACKDNVSGGKKQVILAAVVGSCAHRQGKLIVELLAERTVCKTAGVQRHELLQVPEAFAVL